MSDQNARAAFMAGGCACGKTRFAITAAPIVTHACHCHMCQRRSGSAFAVNAMIETDRVVLLDGELAPDEDGVRCATCRQSLWGHHPACGPGIAIFPIGLMDDAERLAPDVHCFTGSKHPWIDLPRDVPAFAENYEMAVLSDAAMARFAATQAVAS